MNKPLFKYPVILYEETEDGQQNPIPYIVTDKKDPMPPLLFLEEVYQTGEEEPGSDGKPEPIVEYVMHQYLNARMIEDKLGPVEFDKFRVKLGMKPKKKAIEDGNKLIKEVEEKLKNLKGKV